MLQRIRTIIGVLLIVNGLRVDTVYSNETELGQAIRINGLVKKNSGFTASAKAKNASIGGLTRQDVVSLYNNQYVSAFDAVANWSGNLGNCDAGTTSSDYKNSTLQTINYFRAMAGLPLVSLDSGLNAKAQKAALMMIAEANLSHSPSESWACYTVDGAQAAGKSNLALGNHGPAAIVAYMRDSGGGNTAVGHRRWILYPRQVVMGTGSTDARNGFFSGSNALWVISSFGPRPLNPEQISWPPQGYVPYQVVYPRWSFSLNSFPGADFREATVEMKQGETMIKVEVLTVSNGFGNNTLVWEPDGLVFGPSMADKTLTITVKNVIIEGSPRTFTYDVTVIDPNKTVDENDLTPPVISRCPSNVVVANDQGQCSAEVFWTPPIASDNVGVTSVTSSHAPGDLFFVGTTAVAYTAHDAAGNETTCRFDVEVVDSEIPTISRCPSNITHVHTDGGSDPTVSWPDLEITDNCQLDTIASTAEPGDLFPFGHSEVSYRVTDTSGNIASCSFDTNVVFELRLVRGWNLISVPVGPNLSSEELFGDVLKGEIWTWTGHEYRIANTLEPYQGYWIYSTAESQIRITGELDETFEDNEPIFTPGWNLYGPIAILDEPYNSAIYGSIWYWEDSMYKCVHAEDGVLEIGSGYWINSNVEQVYP